MSREVITPHVSSALPGSDHSPISTDIKIDIKIYMSVA